MDIIQNLVKEKINCQKYNSNGNDNDNNIIYIYQFLWPIKYFRSVLILWL